MKMSKNLKKAFKDAIEAGWYLHRESKHLIWRHPKGGQVVTAKTPSDHRAVKNIIAQFSRALELQVC